MALSPIFGLRGEHLFYFKQLRKTDSELCPMR
jgi:hypothetical protein